MKTALKSTLTATLIAGLSMPVLADDSAPVPEDQAVSEAATGAVNPALVLAVLAVALAVALSEDGSDGKRGTNYGTW